MNNNMWEEGEKIIVILIKLPRTNELIYWLIAFFTVSAEMILTFLSIPIGVILYLIILISLLITALMKYQRSDCSLYLALVLVPLIRIVSVSLPLSSIPQVFAFAVVGIPLFTAGVMVAKIIGITPAGIGFDLGFSFDKFYKQFLIALVGIPLGFLEFYACRFPFKDVPATANDILIRVVAFIVCIGLLEEFLFRGILFNTAAKYLDNNKAMVFSSLMYAALTISAGSFINVLFAFLISLLFCGFYVRYQSILGISFAHGLINITLYILCPLIYG